MGVEDACELGSNMAGNADNPSGFQLLLFELLADHNLDLMEDVSGITEIDNDAINDVVNALVTKYHEGIVWATTSLSKTK